jgi:hypothetical protein
MILRLYIFNNRLNIAIESHIKYKEKTNFTSVTF